MQQNGFPTNDFFCEIYRKQLYRSYEDLYWMQSETDKISPRVTLSIT